MARIAAARATATITDEQARLGKLEKRLYGRTVLAPVEVDGIKINALFDSGAANSVINPRLLAAMPSKKKLEILDYNYHYGSAAPDAYLVSQGCVTAPVTFKQYTLGIGRDS